VCEIDVSLILSHDCSLLSASQAELGPSAGQFTWRNCLKMAERHNLVTDANRDDIRDHFKAYGAWDREEIEAWTDTELSAMVWQEAAAAVREFEDHCGGDYDKYEEACERGTISGRLWLTETTATIYLGI
jgi:hypothetical protein